MTWMIPDWYHRALRGGIYLQLLQMAGNVVQ